MKINKIAIAMALMLTSTLSWSRGYVVDPPSRAAMCKQGKNNQCDNMSIYAADSIINTRDFSGDFPEDGKLASGGLKHFSSLNSERGTRWEKNSLEKGQVDISWQFTSPSRVVSYKYYLSKPDWQKRLDKANHLTRDSFVNVPFCQFSGNGDVVQGLVSHHCELPARQGYQLIYAVAEMATSGGGERIYNVIDVDIDYTRIGRPLRLNSEWTKEIATIDRLVDGEPLLAPPGKSIMVRFYSAEGELKAREEQVWLRPGDENEWSYYVAEAINGTHTRIRAGVMHDDGNVYPERDKINNIYVNSTSPLIHAEISFLSPDEQD